MRLMRPLALLLAGLALLPPRAPAAMFDQDFDRETFYRLGWNDACSVAVLHYGFPFLGEALAAEPVMSRIGTYTTAPGQTKPEAKWLYLAKGKFSWKPEKADKAKTDLAKKGYVKAGYKETLRPDPVVDDRDLPRLLGTLDTLKLPADFAPIEEPGFRLAFIHYSPIGACGLLVYYRSGTTKEGKLKEFFRPVLARIGNPVARTDRALAHTTNGLLLFERGDLAGALAETRIAAVMAPDYALARYHYGGQLALAGQTREALAELEAAVRMDPQYKKKARSDLDWDSLAKHPSFKELTR